MKKKNYAQWKRMTSKDINNKSVASTSNNKHKLIMRDLITWSMKVNSQKSFYDVNSFFSFFCEINFWNLQGVAGFPVVDAAADFEIWKREEKS